MRKSLLVLLGALLLLTPASAQVVFVLLEEHFEGDRFPPDEWNVYNYYGYYGWERNDSTGRPNYAGSGYCAIADSLGHDNCSMDTFLSTPELDLTGYSTAELEFNMSYTHANDIVLLLLNISGQPKQVLETWDSSYSGKVTIDLTPYCGNKTKLEWLYHGQGGWCEIDDVRVTAGTAAIPEFPGFALVLAVLASILGVLLRR